MQSRWLKDEYSLGKFDQMLEWHARDDKQDGVTSAYIFQEGATDDINGLSFK